MVDWDILLPVSSSKERGTLCAGGDNCPAVRKSGERGEVTGDVDKVLAVDDRVLRPEEGWCNCTRVAFPIFAIIVPLLERILFGRLSSPPAVEVPNVAVDLAVPGRSRVGSANGLPAVLLTDSFSISSAVNAIRPSGDRPGVA
jgi:hypothetical protein